MNVVHTFVHKDKTYNFTDYAEMMKKQLELAQKDKEERDALVAENEKARAERAGITPNEGDDNEGEGEDKKEKEDKKEEEDKKE